jgi:hypothetical protein
VILALLYEDPARFARIPFAPGSKIVRKTVCPVVCGTAYRS